MTKDLRSYIELLEKIAPEEVIRIKRKVSPIFETSAIAAKLEQKNKFPLIIFENVEGSKIPIVTNLLADVRKMAIALGTTVEKLNEEFRKRESNPLPPKVVADGPVKEVVMTGNKVDLTKLPICAHNEKDAGPYITAGVMIMKDPETKAYNDGCYRLMLKGKNKLGVHFAEVSHSFTIYKRSEEIGEPLQVAIVIGHHPAFLLGALSFVPLGTDELAVDGGIMGEPLEVVKCETNDLLVPANAEIVIEGEIPVKVREREGPLGEYTGLYGKEMMNPVVNVKAITMREKPIYYDVLPGHTEQVLWGGTPRISFIYKTVKIACPSVKDVFMPPSGRCRFICYISVDKKAEGEPKNAIFGAFTADPYIKYCVAVDPDVNIFDDSSVLKAIALWCKADRDIFIIRRAKGSPLDPTASEGYLVTKIGIDATRPLVGAQEMVKVPNMEKCNLKDYGIEIDP